MEDKKNGNRYIDSERKSCTILGDFTFIVYNNKNNSQIALKPIANI